MTDPTVKVARAAAVVLAAELAPDVPAQVEAVLHACDRGQHRPGQYDPLAIAGLAMGAGSLIVAVAQLAWSIYTDRREHAPEPEPESIARQIRIRLRAQDMPVPAGSDRITEVVITELIRLTKD